MRRRVFRRLLARGSGTGANAPAIAAAACRACERLAEHLIPLIGEGGFAAVCARSLHVAQRRIPAFALVRASDQRDEAFGSLQQSLEQMEPAAATEAAVTLLATASSLLASFIGENLTNRLLGEAWPDDFAGNSTEETIR